MRQAPDWPFDLDRVMRQAKLRQLGATDCVRALAMGMQKHGFDAQVIHRNVHVVCVYLGTPLSSRCSEDVLSALSLEGKILTKDLETNWSQALESFMRFEKDPFLALSDRICYLDKPRHEISAPWLEEYAQRAFEAMGNALEAAPGKRRRPVPTSGDGHREVEAASLTPLQAQALEHALRYESERTTGRSFEYVAHMVGYAMEKLGEAHTVVAQKLHFHKDGISAVWTQFHLTDGGRHFLLNPRAAWNTLPDALSTRTELSKLSTLRIVRAEPPEARLLRLNQEECSQVMDEWVAQKLNEQLEHQVPTPSGIRKTPRL